MVRATNTGTTGAINQQGQVIAALPAHRAGVLDVSVQGQQGTTIFVRAGDWTILLCSILVLGSALVVRSRRPARSPDGK